MAAEFVIVGGGAYGCAVAYHLASAGASVQLLEAGHIAEGASGGPGKRGVRANRRDLRELPLMRQAYDLWPELGEQLGASTGYERTGGVSLIEREVVGVSGGLVSTEAHAAAQAAFGIPTEKWDQERIQSVFPGISQEVRAGLYAPLDGVASQAETTAAYAAAARRLGVTITEETFVAQVRPQAAGATALSSSGEQFTATRAVLLAANSGVLRLAETAAGRSLPLWTIYPQALFLKAAEPAQIPLLTGHDDRALSVKILQDDIIMLSGGWRGRHNPQTGRGELDPAAVSGNIEQLTAVFPELGELTLVEGQASRPESVAVDQVPLIGALTDHVYAAAGWSGHGWALVPSASKHIAHLLLHGEYTPELAPLSLARIPTLGGRDA
ncbi:NAD(P)/FAD-dependent oxidoreductase [Nesterenkonia alkaliphila]|uniref:FAD-dependent oxidoreductase n=1 Tax=Nesterenkonia alkaliphila TaxID=1463631 RepID=A0A7K1UGP5_9MICC|nr:FAD-binding oxidoreductase [Nesterenkonia alkaliphila]MVT25574.1 FAD-dependent oxidoreductase [Nesterenkonia alkaliphila]GFZ95094.1 FAD-dependent oxidoreductase [Nesterenkonia alkaliphila]